MNRAAALAVACLLSLVAAPPASAQQRGALHGRVLREDGTPLPGVMVVLRESGAVAWTTADGKYRFDQVAPGAVTLNLSLGGYSTEVTAEPRAGADVAVPDTAVDWTTSPPPFIAQSP